MSYLGTVLGIATIENATIATTYDAKVRTYANELSKAREKNSEIIALLTTEDQRLKRETLRDCGFAQTFAHVPTKDNKRTTDKGGEKNTRRPKGKQTKGKGKRPKSRKNDNWRSNANDWFHSWTFGKEMTGINRRKRRPKARPTRPKPPTKRRPRKKQGPSRRRRNAEWRVPNNNNNFASSPSLFLTQIRKGVWTTLRVLDYTAVGKCTPLKRFQMPYIFHLRSTFPSGRGGPKKSRLVYPTKRIMLNESDKGATK